MEVYDLLFETVWATLSAFGTDPKRLDGQLGMTAMLQNLRTNAGAPCPPALPGARRRPGSGRRLASGQEYLPLPGAGAVAAASSVGCAPTSRPAACRGSPTPGRSSASSMPCWSSEWVLYSKPCLARTDTIIDYLGR